MSKFPLEIVDACLSENACQMLTKFPLLLLILGGKMLFVQNGAEISKKL